MRILKALKAAWRELWRVWRYKPAIGLVRSESPKQTPKPVDVPSEGYVYVGIVAGRREMLVGSGSKAKFLIARKLDHEAQLWSNGILRDWNPR